MNGWTMHHSKEFDAQDREWLSAALTDPLYTIDDLESDVRRGMAAVYRAEVDGGRIGCMAVRIDGGPHGDELIVVAAGGKTPYHGGSILMTLAPYAARLAKELNCVRVRAHSRVRAVQILMERGGWKEAERVFTMEAA